MLIRSFLQGEVFDTALVVAMSGALVDACKVLGILSLTDDPAVDVLAIRIIKQGRAGVRDRKLLTAGALAGLASEASA